MKPIYFLFAILWVAGCALPPDSSNNPVKTCKYVERDLTATWEQRSYWCLPYKKQKQNKRIDLSKETNS